MKKLTIKTKISATYLILIGLAIFNLKCRFLEIGLLGSAGVAAMLFIAIFYEDDLFGNETIPLFGLLSIVLFSVFWFGVFGLDDDKNKAKEDSRVVTAQEISNALAGCPLTKVNIKDGLEKGGGPIRKIDLERIYANCRVEASEMKDAQIAKEQLKGIK